MLLNKSLTTRLIHESFLTNDIHAYEYRYRYAEITEQRKQICSFYLISTN